MTQTVGIMMTRRLGLLLLAAPLLYAQQPAASGIFLRLQSRDTLSVERFTRVADSLVGEIAQGGQITHYKASVRPDGSVARFEFAGNPPQIQSAQLDMGPTLIEGQRTRFGGAVFPVRMVNPTRPMPVLFPSVAHY